MMNQSIALYVGRISWHKGTDILNDVADQLPSNIKIVAVGFGNFPLNPKIEFMGKKEPAEVAEIMRRSDMLIHPSRMEGLCRVIQEAQATGLPVICADVGGNSELVIHMVNGLMVELSAKAFTHAVVRLARDNDLRRGLGQAALENSYKFDWDNTVKEYHSIMEGLIEVHR